MVTDINKSVANRDTINAENYKTELTSYLQELVPDVITETDKTNILNAAFPKKTESTGSRNPVTLNSEPEEILNDLGISVGKRSTAAKTLEMQKGLYKILFGQAPTNINDLKNMQSCIANQDTNKLFEALKYLSSDLESAIDADVAALLKTLSSRLGYGNQVDRIIDNFTTIRNSVYKDGSTDTLQETCFSILLSGDKNLIEAAIKELAEIDTNGRANGLSASVLLAVLAKAGINPSSADSKRLADAIFAKYPDLKDKYGDNWNLLAQLFIKYNGDPEIMEILSKQAFNEKTGMSPEFKEMLRKKGFDPDEFDKDLQTLLNNTRQYDQDIKDGKIIPADPELVHHLSERDEENNRANQKTYEAAGFHGAAQAAGEAADAARDARPVLQTYIANSSQSAAAPQSGDAATPANNQVLSSTAPPPQPWGGYARRRLAA
jgi:hypothetical protein